ncbi:glutamic acid-rich protein-like isoform X2 [Ostrea edulis]|uniref:glutamic acid-rich protein-like isoform X2 n=1 Tax=Ostrea edulis TaxID=37623 RepID=UPI0024AF5041|nr:glutamic acid-rich protein-like isoform X2 [Ostrea edulis]
MNKKDKPGIFSFKKKKKNKSKDIGATEEEITKLTDRQLKREEKQTQAHHVPASVVTLKNENVGANQQRVNERPVDVGPSVRTNATVTEAQKVVSHSPQVQSNLTDNIIITNHNRGIEKQNKENGKSGKTVERMDPKASKRVHSFSVSSPEQGTSQLLSKEEKRKLKQFASDRSPHTKNDSLSYENEEVTSSKKKKKGRSLLKSFTGKKEKAKRSLAKSFEEEAAKTKEETVTGSPDDDDSDEEDEDDWDHDHNNPFSSSFQLQEVHTAQPVAEKVQQKEVSEVQFYVERENSRESDNVEFMEDVDNSESKTKKKKFKVPSFRKSKKDKEKSLSIAKEMKSDIPLIEETAIQQHPHRTASLPVKLEEEAALHATTMPDVVIRQPGLLAADKPHVLTRSHESPDNFETAEIPGQFLSREERNKSKQFSSMRISKKNEKDVITYEDEDIPTNINKKSRQESKLFSSFRRKKPPKKMVLEQVTEDIPEDAEATNDLDVGNPFSSAYKQSETPGVRSSAPSNLAGPSISTREMSSADGDSGRRAPPASTESATLARNEGILEKETRSNPTQKKKKGNSIKKTFSFRRSSKESKEQESSFSTQPIEEDVMEEEEEEIHPDVEVFSNSQFQESVQESEVDLEERKRQLELVFKDMESESEDEHKEKTKKPKIFKNALKKIGKKKKTKPDQPEDFPLMEQDQPVENVKKKNTSEKIVEVKGQLGELKDIAHDNINKLYEREDNLDDLEDRAGQLSETASMFHKTSIQVKTKMETCNKRTKTIIIGVVIALLALVVIILVAVVANKSNDTEIRTVHIVHVVNGTAPYFTPSPG